MQKIKIEGLDIKYKNVSDLHEKVKDTLVKVKTSREETEEKLNQLRKRERGLRKFLGLDTSKEDSRVQPS